MTVSDMSNLFLALGLAPLVACLIQANPSVTTTVPQEEADMSEATLEDEDLIVEMDEEPVKEKRRAKAAWWTRRRRRWVPGKQHLMAPDAVHAGDSLESKRGTAKRKARSYHDLGLKEANDKCFA